MSQIGEIGTHVHFRKKDGKFCYDFEFQKDLIEEATYSLKSKGFDIHSFRGGDLFFNNDTLKILENLRYEVDSSVLQGFSRKIQDHFFINHRIQKIKININEPYYLSDKNYLLSGKSSILEIPVTNLAFFLKKPSFFIPFPIPGNDRLGNISNISFFLTKILGVIKKDIPIVFLFHDFNFSRRNSLAYFRNFIDKCSNDKNIKFVTLNEIKKECLEHKY